MKYMFKIPFCCILVKYIFEDRERYVCFFVETSTAHHHNVALTHTHTHTHTHMTVQQWMRGQVDPDFSGFCNFNFDPVRSAIF